MSVAHAASDRTGGSLMERLNGSHHELALRLFMAIVLAHWAEHLLQGFQIYGLGWPVPEARGLVGYFFPWVIQSETLHYGYAIVMLIGLWTLRGGFAGAWIGDGGRSPLPSSSSITSSTSPHHPGDYRP